MALEVESVVDGGVDAEKPLCGAGRFEALPSYPRTRIITALISC